MLYPTPNIFSVCTLAISWFVRNARGVVPEVYCRHPALSTSSPCAGQHSDLVAEIKKKLHFFFHFIFNAPFAGEKKKIRYFAPIAQRKLKIENENVESLEK